MVENDGKNNRNAGVMPGFLMAGLLVLIGFLGIFQLQPPDAVSIDAQQDVFSSGRAMEHLKTIAAFPHPAGSDYHGIVHDYIIQELRNLGFEPEIQTAEVVRRSRSGSLNVRTARFATVSNIIAVHRGKGGTGAVLLMSHYDSVPHAPGASDDGAAVAAMLETARALKSKPPLENDVIFLFTDAEELGLLGAQAFVDNHPLTSDIEIVLNYEAMGSSGQSMLFETSDGNGRLIREFAKAAPHPVGTSLSYEIYRRMPNDTDLTRFKIAEYHGLNFSYVGDVYDYHTMGDNLDNIHEGSLQHHGSNMLALAEHFGNIDLDNLEAPNAVYFNVFGTFFVHYPENLIVVFMVFVVLSFLAYIIYGFMTKQLKALGVLFGFIGFLAACVIAPVVILCTYGIISKSFTGQDMRLLLYGQNMLLIGIVFITAGLTIFFYRLCMSGMRIWHAIVLCAGIIALLYFGDLFSWKYIIITFVAVGLLLFIFRKARDYRDLTAGALFGWTVIMCIVSILIPGGSYMFVWPLILAIVQAVYVMIVRMDNIPSIMHVAVLVVLSVPAILWFAGLMYLFVCAMGLDAVAYAMFAVSLLFGLLIPHIRIMTASGKWLIPAGSALLGIAIFLITLTDLDYDTRHRKVNTLNYRLNADTGIASWGTSGRDTDEWTSLYIQDKREGRNIGREASGSAPGGSLIEAPAINLDGPSITVIADHTENNIRTLVLRAQSIRKAPVMIIGIESKSNIRKARLNNIGMIEPGAYDSRSGFKSMEWTYIAFPEEGVEIELGVNESDSLTIRLSDISMGLPEIPGFIPRPEYMMPAASFYSDVTLVRKSFVF